MAENDDKLLGMLAHLLGIFTAFIGALVIYVVKKDSDFVRENARNALNFQICVMIAWLAVYVLVWFVAFMPFGFFGLFGILGLLSPAVWVVSVIFSIIAGLKAHEGEVYKYPISYEFIK